MDKNEKIWTKAQKYEITLTRKSRDGGEKGRIIEL